MKCARVFATLLLSLTESEDEDIQKEMMDRLQALTDDPMDTERQVAEFVAEAMYFHSEKVNCKQKMEILHNPETTELEKVVSMLDDLEVAIRPSPEIIERFFP